MTSVRTLPGTTSPDDPRLPEAVRKRWKIVDERALTKVEVFNARIGDARMREIGHRLEQLRLSKEPARLRLRQLYAIADEMTSYVKGLAACQRGCAHCCYIGVPLNRTEAELIGSDIRRKPRFAKLKSPEESERHFEQFDYGYHNPCTFLKDGQCSIYEHRPLTCRVHFNMDDDDLLCRLDHGLVPVPYLDVTLLRAIYLFIGGARLADVREFFPKEGAP